MKKAKLILFIIAAVFLLSIPAVAQVEKAGRPAAGDDSLWLSFLSILCTFIAIFLGLLYRSLFQWRKEILGELEKFCRRNENDHGLMWNRINFHGHTSGGHVVITRGAEDFRPPEKE